MSQENVQHDREFENEALEVVRLRLGPDATVSMHEAPDMFVVFLTETHLRLTYPDGETTEEHRSPGETTWYDARSHEGQNLTSNPIELLSVRPQ